MVPVAKAVVGLWVKGVKVVEILTSSVVEASVVVVVVLGANVLNTGPLVVAKTGRTFNGVVGFDPT